MIDRRSGRPGPTLTLLATSLGVWAITAVLVPLGAGTFWVVEAAVLLTPALTVPLVLGPTLTLRRWLPGLAGLALTAVVPGDPPHLASTLGAVVWFGWCTTLLVWPTESPLSTRTPWSPRALPAGRARDWSRSWAVRLDPGRAFLAFGALLLVFSRGGWLHFGPVHIAEPLMLLGCAHFTVAGFGLLALIDAAINPAAVDHGAPTTRSQTTSAAGSSSEGGSPSDNRGLVTGRRSTRLGWSRRLAIGGAVLVGVGHMAGRTIELAGTVVLTLAIAFLSIASWQRARTVAPRPRALLRASAWAPLLSMTLALHYAVTLSTGSAHLPYDLMVVAHGLVNLLVLVTGGLIGWRSPTVEHGPSLVVRRRALARDRRGS